MSKDTEKTLVVRMPAATLRKLDRAAKLAQRSRSAEVRVRLESSLKAAHERIAA